MHRSILEFGKDKRFLAGFMCLAAVVLFAQPSHALFMGFAIAPGTGNSAPSVIPDIEAQLLVQLVDNGDDTVTFTFFNLIDPVTGTPGSITHVYFSDTTSVLDWASGVDINTSVDGVSFSSGASPGNLPGHHFPSSTLTSFDSDSPGKKPNGVDAIDEWVSFTVGFASGNDFTALESALVLPPGSPAFRIGIKVQGLPGGESDAFVNNPPDDTTTNAPPVPEPATMGLLGMGIAAMVLRKRNAKF